MWKSKFIQQTKNVLKQLKKKQIFKKVLKELLFNRKINMI